MSTTQRFVRLTILAACALLAVACSGKTTGASNVSLAPDGSYSAKLNAVGTCSTKCTAFLRWRQVGTTAWTNSPTLNVGSPVSNVPFGQTASGLRPATLYEYQVCGAENGGASACVGSDGTSNTTQAFNTGPAASTVHANWTQLHPANAPSPRAANMAYDPATDQDVLFGGYFIPVSYGDTWTWDGTDWTQRHPNTTPPARDAQQMAYDTATGQLIMFGGDQAGVGNLNDTWNWTGSDWARLNPPTSPPNRSNAAIAYDPVTRQIVLFGGFQITTFPYGNLENDTWTWNGTTWTQEHPATRPPVNTQGQMVFDPQLGKLILFGGLGTTGSWAWDGTTWSHLNLPVNPSDRDFPALALDPTTGEDVLTGGRSFSDASFLTDTWSLDEGWTPLAPATPAPAVTGTLTPDPGSGHLVDFGGYSASGITNGTWVYGPLTITAQALPGATTGLAYSHALQATGGVGALRWSLTAGSLPPGLALSSSTGTITGTPSATGTSSFTVTATDSSSPAQSTSRSFAIAVAQGPVPGVYVANGANSEINGFALGAGGNVKPEVTIAGPATTLDGPGGLAFDQLGRLYVANSGLDTIDIFTPGANGNIAPAAVLGGSNTNITNPYGVTLDSAGDLYVANRPANTVTVYAPGAAGNVAPVRTISGGNTHLDGPEALVVDAAGNLWVANTNGNQISEFPAGANGNVAPIAAFTTGINFPQALTQDAAGDILSANTFGESVYISPTKGTYLPSPISGSATGLAFPDGIDVDSAGRIYVANQSGGLNIYAAGSTGNVSPIAIIAGSNTNLAAPGPVAVTPPLYIATTGLRRARVHHSYRVALRARLGRSPLRWRIVKGHLPRGLRLTREGVIVGMPSRRGITRFTVQVTDATRPAMRARERLVLRVN